MALQGHFASATLKTFAEKLEEVRGGTEEVSGVSTTDIATGIGKWWGGVVVDGKIYGIPYAADHIFVYDPQTGEGSGVDIDSRLAVVGEMDEGLVAWGGT